MATLKIKLVVWKNSPEFIGYRHNMGRLCNCDYVMTRQGRLRAPSLIFEGCCAGPQYKHTHTHKAVFVEGSPAAANYQCIMCHHHLKKTDRNIQHSLIQGQRGGCVPLHSFWRWISNRGARHQLQKSGRCLVNPICLLNIQCLYYIDYCLYPPSENLDTRGKKSYIFFWNWVTAAVDWN